MFCLLMSRKTTKPICYYHLSKDKLYTLIKYCCLSLKKRLLIKRLRLSTESNIFFSKNHFQLNCFNSPFSKDIQIIVMIKIFNFRFRFRWISVCFPKIGHFCDFWKIVYLNKIICTELKLKIDRKFIHNCQMCQKWITLLRFMDMSQFFKLS